MRTVRGKVTKPTTYLEAAALAILHEHDSGEADNELAAMMWFCRRDARAALAAVGFTEAMQQAPVGSLELVPADVEYASRVAAERARIERAGPEGEA